MLLVCGGTPADRDGFGATVLHVPPQGGSAESVASLHTDGAAVYDVRWCDPPHHLGRIWGRVRMRESVASLHPKATLPPADTPASEITVVYSILRVREIVLSHS